MSKAVAPSRATRAIPKALRQQVWLKYIGEKFQHKCIIEWCQNKITVFNFDCGHNVPFSKGGETTLENLRPICSNCNKSMSDTHTIDEWNKIGCRSSGGHSVGGKKGGCCW